MVRLSLSLAAVICLVFASPLNAGQGESRPRPVRPKAGAVFKYHKSPPSILLGWKVPGPVGNYVVQIERKSGSTAEVATFVVKKQTSFSFQPQREGRYRWWVAVLGPDGEPGRPGPARYFVVAPGTTGTRTPRAPNPVRPPDGQTFVLDLEEPSVDFAWSKRKVAKYQLELARDPGFHQKIESSTGAETSASIQIESPGKTYWRVRGIEPDTRWSAVRSFGFAPRAPRLAKPKDGMSSQFRGLTTGVKLSWKKVPHADAYLVEVTSKDRKAGEPKRTKNTYLTVKNLAAGLYRWRVRAVHSSGTRSDSSPSWTFVLVQEDLPAADSQANKTTRDRPEFPAAPKLQAPRDGARIQADTPKKVLLFWEPLVGASAYEVVVSASEDFSSVVVQRKLKGSMMPLPKPPRGKSFWRVRGVDPNGQTGEWSEVWKFSYREQSLWDD